ncbi:hypothetical protein BDP27DRAFT_1404337 [Rhodocollybia butyracea]|uniref:Uncharacterized protein n=1 Tax=Rhodocollybia butyracea TaxID=206335 RepID=A0A9P5PNV1_9AGAR|nr:hypothetical protein BDP27DRAFT_1404337 [Rhodocollybia butyracea]
MHLPSFIKVVSLSLLTAVTVVARPLQKNRGDKSSDNERVDGPRDVKEVTKEQNRGGSETVTQFVGGVELKRSFTCPSLMTQCTHFDQMFTVPVTCEQFADREPDLHEQPHGFK